MPLLFLSSLISSTNSFISDFISLDKSFLDMKNYYNPSIKLWRTLEGIFFVSEKLFAIFTFIVQFLKEYLTINTDSESAQTVLSKTYIITSLVKTRKW